MGGEENPRAHNGLTKRWIILTLVASMLVTSLLSVLFFATSSARHDHNVIVKSNLNLLHGRITDRAGILLHVNASAFALADALRSMKINSVSEMAERLRIAFSTSELVSHVSYISKNGLVLSYRRDNRTNAGLSENFDACYFYNKTIDQHTGERYGSSVGFSYQPCSATKEWFLDALNGEAGNATISNQTIFFTASVNNSGAVSVGVDLKDFLRHVSEAVLDRSYLFITINCLPGSQVSAYLNHFVYSLIDSDSSCLVRSDADIMEQLRSIQNSSLQVEIPRVPMVMTLAFPDDKTMKMLLVLKVISICLAAVMLICIATFTFFMVWHLKRSKIQEAVLQAELISLKEAVKQAERKSMNKSMAFHQASHDVRNKLYSIIGLIEICQAEITPSSELATNLAMMNDCAVDLLGLLNTVLDTSKVESGKIHLEQAAFNISEIIEKSVDSFNVLAEKKDLEMIWDPCDFSVLKSAKVIGDRQRFKQVLDNLLGNAVKFTSEGKIILRAWAREPSLKFLNISSDYGCSISHMFCCLSRRVLRHFGSKINQQGVNCMQHNPDSIELTFEVDDTGCGIPVEKRASVFENYVQVKDNSPEGTGLGLGIVQSLVRLMGGEIRIQDKDPFEKGTCFKFNIFLRSGEVAHYYASRNEETNQSTIGEPFTLNEPRSTNTIHSLLFVEGSETKRILQTWIESLGIKVWMVQQAEKIFPTLEKIKNCINSSTKSDSVLLCKTFSRKANSVQSEGFSQATALCSELPLGILVIVDLSTGNLSEIFSSLINFIERNPNLHCKIVSIADSKVTEKDLSKFRSLLCDLTLRKPIHGSRLRELFKLIQEVEKTEELCISRLATSPLAEPQIEMQVEKHCEITEEISMRVKDTPPLRGKRVLLVDDDDVIRMMGSTILSNKLGAEVESAKHGLEALDLVKKALETGFTRGTRSDYSFTYDAIFMDCQMPVMDGYEAARQIRKEESRYGIHVPIIALSADASDEEVQKRCCTAGMDLHLAKPLTDSKVLEAFARIGV